MPTSVRQSENVPVSYPRRLQISPSQATLYAHLQGFCGSPLTDSNRRPPPYHGGALPTELRGRSVQSSDGFPRRSLARSARSSPSRSRLLSLRPPSLPPSRACAAPMPSALECSTTPRAPTSARSACSAVISPFSRRRSTSLCSGGSLPSPESSPARKLNFMAMQGGGFEPPKAEPAGLQPAPFGHSGTPAGAGHCSPAPTARLRSRHGALRRARRRRRAGRVGNGAPPRARRSASPARRPRPLPEGQALRRRAHRPRAAARSLRRLAGRRARRRRLRASCRLSPPARATKQELPSSS